MAYVLFYFFFEQTYYANTSLCFTMQRCLIPSKLLTVFYQLSNSYLQGTRVFHLERTDFLN